MKINLRNRKQAVLIGIAVVAVAFILWEVVQRSGGPAGPGGFGRGGPAVAVEVVPVETGALTDAAQFSGSLIPKTSFTIAPKISGKLQRLLVDIGDTVRRGQLVAVLEDAEYRQQVIQAEADLRVAEANLEEALSSLEIAKRDLERARTLHQKQIQSDAQLDAAISQYGAQEARYKVARAQAANREAALESARVRLSYTQIRADWEKGGESRLIGERFVNEGALLSPNTPLLSVIELQPITAVIFVTDKDYFRLSPDQAATITSSAFPGEIFAGRVARIAPLLKETSREARVEIEIANTGEKLKPGMFINTRVSFSRREGVTIVPVSALVNRDGRQGIFMADLGNRKAVFTPVTLGVIEGERAEVVAPAGLAGSVVTLGHHLLEDGAGILVPGAEPAAAADGRGRMPGKKPGGKPAEKRAAGEQL